MKKTTRTLKGFTLIELGVAICIVSILTSIIVPNLNENIIAANKASDLSNAKLIYEETMIVLGTNQDAAVSFYNENCSTTPQVKEPVYEWQTLPDGTKVKVFKTMKKVTTSKGQVRYVPVARMVGVSRNAFYTYSNAQKQYGGNGNSGANWQSVDYYDGLWEDCGVGDQAQKQKVRARAELPVSNTNAAHAAFIKALSEKEGIPLCGDPGTTTDKPYYPMRYCTHPHEAVEGRKYTYKWLIDYDTETLQVGVKAGWHHMDQGSNGFSMNCFHLYPDTCAEYRDEQFYVVK